MSEMHPLPDCGDGYWHATLTISGMALQRAELDEAGLAELRAMFPRHATCRTYWGSHGCSLPDEHEGDRHQCLDGVDVCSEVDQDGYDSTGLQWELY